MITIPTHKRHKRLFKHSKTIYGKGKEIWSSTFRLATKFLLFAMEVSSYLLKFEILHIPTTHESWMWKSLTTFPLFIMINFFREWISMTLQWSKRVVYFLVAWIEVRLTTFAISTPYGSSSSSHSHFSSHAMGSWLIFILFFGWSLGSKNRAWASY